MSGRLIRSELLKLCRTPSTWWLAFAAVGVCLLGVGLTLSLGDVRDRDDIRSLLSFAGTGGLVLLLLGVVAGAAEYRHRTIIPTTLVTPRRAKAFAAQTAAIAAFGIAVGLVAAAATTVVALGWLWSAEMPIDLTAADLAKPWLGAAAYTSLSAAIGLAIGALARNQVAAAGTVFIYLSMIDPLVAMAWSGYGRFGPTAISIALSGGVEEPGGPGAVLLPMWLAGLVYLAVAATSYALATAITSRRDLA